MTLLYPYKAKGSDEELRYSLRSVAANLPHDNILIVGDKPDWLQGVHHIKTPHMANKHTDLRAKLEAAILSSELSDDFIYMNDDFFVMHEVAQVPQYHRGTISEVIKETRERGAPADYINAMVAAQQALVEWGVRDPLSFELHVPMEFNRFRMLSIFEEFNSDALRQFRSLYGNVVYGNVGYMQDVKVRSGQRDWSHGGSYLSTDNNSFANGRVGQYIKDTFTEKCKYEK